MSAELIYDLAPLGALIRHTDGTPRPPDHHCIKLAAWEARNNVGRLSRKRSGTREGPKTRPAFIMLQRCTYVDGHVTVLPVHYPFAVDCDVKFTVIDRPAAGSILVLDRPGDDPVLLHVAANMEDATSWMASRNYLHAVLREVSADETAADAVEGRAAA